MNTVCLSIDLGLLCFLSAMFYCFHHKDLEHVLLNVHLSFYESVSIARGEENGWMGKMVKENTVNNIVITLHGDR